MATIRAYTTIEQSRKLAKFLPLESADMHYSKDFDGSWFADLAEYASVKIPKYVDKVEEHLLPCWSLAALLGVIPCSYGVYRHPYDDGLSLSLQISNCIEVVADNEMDACYEMILKLNKMNLL